jgi:hypothetical protein
MKSLVRLGRAAVTLAVGLTLLAATAEAVHAAPSGTNTASAKSVASTSPGVRKATANAPVCPVPGQRVKTTWSAAVYLVGPYYELKLIPDADVYFSLWDSWNGIVTNNDLWNCYVDGHYSTMFGTDLAKESGNAAVYIYDYYRGGYRLITSPEVFNKYGFSWSKIQTRDSVSPKSTLDWNY